MCCGHRIPGPAHLGQFGAPSDNTKYGIDKRPRRTENHDGLGLALADPRHPEHSTVQTTTKRHQSLRRHRRRSPHICRPAASPFHTHAEPSRYWGLARTGQMKGSGSTGTLGIAKVLRNRPKKRHPAGPAPGSFLWSKWRGGVRHGGKREQVSNCGSKGRARVGETKGIRCRFCTNSYRSRWKCRSVVHPRSASIAIINHLRPYLYVSDNGGSEIAGAAREPMVAVSRLDRTCVQWACSSTRASYDTDCL